MSEAASSKVAPGAGLTRALSDGRLARRAVQGDERAFAAIFRRYHQPLYRYCLAIVGDSADAEDALQNAMVKVLRALPGEQRQIELKPWLYRIAHNESIELLRRRRETRQLDAELPAPGPGLAQEAATRERLRLLISDLDELPDRQRGALVMRELAGLGFDEIGAALGTSPAVARQTLYEARLSLRQMDEGREMSCEVLRRALSDGDRRVLRRRDIRAHLRACSDCRRFGEEIEQRQHDFAALSPLPAVVAAGLLQGLLGGGQGGAGAGLATAIGGGAAKSVGATAALKGAATVAVVAAIGVTAADRGGLIDAGLPGNGGGPQPAPRAGANADGEWRQALPPPGPARRAVAGKAAAAGAGGALGPSRSARAAAAAHRDRAPGTNDDAPSPQSAAPGSAASHPHGKGHEKALPGAAEHGQQTAAGHKAHGHSGGRAPSKGSKSAASAHPAHPTHPAHPAKPPSPPPSGSGSEKAPAAPDPSAATTPEAHGKAATPGAAAEGEGSDPGARKP